MGGIGSGRQWCIGNRDCTHNYPDLDVRELNKAGLLSPGNAFTWQWVRHRAIAAEIGVETDQDRVQLHYSHADPGGCSQSERLTIYLTHTPCHLGGKRPWFLCPVVGCGKRVAILYGAGVFACRSCHSLAYPSQREERYARARRKAQRIRQKLGWDGGIISKRGGKPKGMHWATFRRLTAQHDEFAQISLDGTYTKLNALTQFD